MDTYDVAVIGGGISGSVAARFAAKHGFSTLLIEKFKTPRNKSCSGIQFPYLEKLIGEKIPPEALCSNTLNKVEMFTPSGKTVKGSMKMLNFWRSTFDSWLNSLAVKAGAKFFDESKLVDFDEDDTGITLQIADKRGESQVRARYLIGADGLNSGIRKKLKPQDFKSKNSGATLNYYFVGTAELDPNTLYMFYNRDFSPLMFAWAYLKDDKWVIGTGADKNLLEYAARFLNYIQEKYAVRGELVKREGFSSPMEITPYLGQRRILLTGDAAGLVDLYRGLGMDNAALSGRFAVAAIVEAEKHHILPIERYQGLMEPTLKKIRVNAMKQAVRYASNDSLETSLSTFNIMKDGLLMLAAAQVNKLLPPEKILLLPM
jgi:geranylgeranyl reductase family protein